MRLLKQRGPKRTTLLRGNAVTSTILNQAESLNEARLPTEFRKTACLPLFILPAIVLCVAWSWPAWMLMWGLAISIFAGLKWLTFVDDASTVANFSRGRALGYLIAWPGLDAAQFLSNKSGVPGSLREWMFAALKTAAGVLALRVAVARAREWPDLLTGWLGMVGIVLLLHFGLFHILSLSWRRVGVNAAPLMNWPITAASLADFWGRRWNVAFRDVSFRHLYRPLVWRCGPRSASLAVFVVSGLIHDAVISIPAGAGYGLPTLYFVLQGVGLLIEQSRRGRGAALGSGIAGRACCLALVAVPLPLLFHRPFVLNVVLPMLQAAMFGGVS